MFKTTRFRLPENILNDIFRQPKSFKISQNIETIIKEE
jgi:hypothetical protein